MVDYKKIQLDGERSGHLTKRLNRLSTWGFFKVLYRDSMGKMLLSNFMLLVAFAPLVVAVVYFMVQANNLLYTLPVYGTLGAGNGIWLGANAYYETMKFSIYNQALLWCLLAVLSVSLLFSGGFGILRDAFWTGKITILKPFADGVRSAFGYALATVVILGGGVAGIFEFYLYASAAMPLWLAITLTVLMSIVLFMVFVYCLIVCSVAVTYKQSVKQTLSDSWKLMWLNPVPNVFNAIVMLLPVGLAFVFTNLQIIILMFAFFIGAFYFALVWQTHMMKTFALFHPVESKKG